MKRSVEHYFAFGSIIMALASLVGLIIFLLFFTSCTFIDEPKYDVDQRLIPYIEEFYKDANNNGCDCRPVSLIAEIVPLDGVNGESYRIPGVNTIPHIAIDEDYFNNAEYYEVKRTIYHELGHALFNLKHTNNGSIMDSDGGDWIWSTPEEMQVLIDNLIKSGCNLYN
jgi:hypothetical protein